MRTLAIGALLLGGFLKSGAQPVGRPMPDIEGEDVDLDIAMATLDEECEKDSSLEATCTKMHDGDYEGVANDLINRYVQQQQSEGPETLEWNESWYETPRDVLGSVSGGVPPNGYEEWLKEQEWRYMTSPVGRPGSRRNRRVSIAYMIARGNGTKGGIVLAPGNAEPIRKYDEAVYDLLSMGYSPIYVMTHRGQGESDRLIRNQRVGYVEDSRDYVHDFRAFTELVAAERENHTDDKDRPLYLLCHSMGCAISLSYLIEEYEARRPSRYYAAVANAPGLKPDTSPFSFGFSMSLFGFLVRLGQGQSYAPTRNPTFEQEHATEKFLTNGETHSFTRYKRYKEDCQNLRYDELGANNHTGLCMVGVTNRFVKEFLELYLSFRDFMKVQGKAIEVPLLLQTAGDPNGTDGFVWNDVSVEFCTDGVSNCVHKNYPDSRHTLLIEVDAVRQTVLSDIDDHFQTYTAALPAVPGELPPGVRADGEGCGRDMHCMSRRCDANFAWDIFGGRCVPQTTFLNGGLPAYGTPALVASLAAVAAFAAAL